MRGDSVIVRKAFGLADVEANIPATPATNYRLASVSKQFTAMAAMLLVKEGKLSLDAPVTDILDRLPPYARAVRVRHLLPHTSGLWDYEDFVPDTATLQVRDADVVELLRNRTDSLYFDPGSAWRYSNTGYCLLALIVERVGGMRYPDFLRSRIFEPAGMANTVAYEAGVSDVAHRAYGHSVSGDSVTRSDQSPTSATLGDGGIYSSIDDLAQWERSLRAHALVDSATWATMTTPATLTDGRPTEYGFGWFIDEFEGHRRLRHHGETRGFTNFVQRFPDDSLYVVVLTNRTGGDPWDAAEQVARHFLGVTETSRP
jgi:CubicO group peptidase (beta-lactamase class C family)